MRSRASCTSAGGDSAPPMTMVFTCDRSWSSKSGWRSSRASCGATPPMLAMCSSAIIRSTSAARQRSIRCRVMARCRYHGSLVMNPMWASWVPDSIAPPAVPGSAQVPPVSMRATAASSRSPNMAPLGTPVVPEVNTTVTRRSGSSGQHRGRGALVPGSQAGEQVVGGAGDLHDLDGEVRGHTVGQRRAGQHERRAGHLEHRGPLGRGRAGVDPGADGAELGQRGVGDDVVRRRRQGQRHQVALAPRRARPGRPRPRRSAGRARRSSAASPRRRRTRPGHRSGRPPRERWMPALAGLRR